MDFIKSQLGWSVINPNNTFVLNDPWCFDNRISHKPTFVNMVLVHKNIQIADFIDDCAWNLNSVRIMLNDSFNSPFMYLGRIDPDTENCWIWLPGSNSNSIVSKVYFYLNGVNSSSNSIVSIKNVLEKSGSDNTDVVVMAALRSIKACLDWHIHH